MRIVQQIQERRVCVGTGSLSLELALNFGGGEKNWGDFHVLACMCV